MDVNLGGSTYVVMFRYEFPKAFPEKRRVRHPERFRRRTVCTVAVVTEPGSETSRRTLHTVASAMVECSLLDNFDRAKGRKMALTAAISGHFDKEERTTIWEAYKLSGAKLE